MAGSLSDTVSRPPSTSRVTSALPPSSFTSEANVPWAQPISAASIWPVWLESSSIACLPSNTRSGLSLAITSFKIFATASGSTVSSVCTRMPRSAPMAKAVRIVSCACFGPMDTATNSSAVPASFKRTPSSTAISSNGFIDILTFDNSTPVSSDLTRILTL